MYVTWAVQILPAEKKRKQSAQSTGENNGMAETEGDWGAPPLGDADPSPPGT